MTARRVTIKDVGRLANVSIATVTRAFQQDPRIPVDTRNRVVEAARELGYRPNHVAQALVTGSSRTLGLLIPRIGDSYWAEVAGGIEERAEAAGFAVLFASSQGDADRVRRLLDLFTGKRVDGIIVADAAGSASPESLGTTAPGAETPAVVIGWDPPVSPTLLDVADPKSLRSLHRFRAGAKLARHEPPRSHVAFDDFDAGAQAARHLLDLGHRHIAFVGGRPRLATALRMAGAQSALQDAGLSLHAIRTGADTLESGRRAARSLLARSRRISAVIAYDDLVAIGALQAARELGRTLPDDLSVTGVDDIEWTDFVDPPLTTVRQPKQELGARAVELLFRVLDDPAHAETAHLQGTLIQRRSTAVPKA